MEAQQNRGIEKAQTQRSIKIDTLKNTNPKKSVKLIVPVAINKGLRQGITTPKQTQGATFGEKVNQGLHAAGSAQSNGAMVDTLKRGKNNVNGGMPNRGVAVVDTLKRAEKKKEIVIKSDDSKNRMTNEAKVDTLKKADLKKLADELVNKADIKKDTLKKARGKIIKNDGASSRGWDGTYKGKSVKSSQREEGNPDTKNDTLKPSAKVEVRGWDPKDKSTISETGKVILIDIKENLDSKENKSIETGVINSGETVDIKKNKIDVIKGTANPSNERATGNLKVLFPPSKGHFTSTDEIENFTWELIGADIQNAVYVITITIIGNNQQSQQTFTATTPNSEISAKKIAKFKAGKALADTVKRTGNQNQGENGEYQWTVTETTTGISSEPSFFTISDKLGDLQGYDENSAMLAMRIDQSALRNTNTVMDSDSKSLTGKRDERMDIRALRIRDARHGFRASHNDARTKKSQIKDERIKPAHSNDARIKDARMGARTGKRYEDIMRTNKEHSDQRIEIITDKDFKVAPQTDIDTKYLRIKNHQTVQISKGSLQLIAPLLSVQNTNDPVVYAWMLRNKDQNMEQSFSGNSINYDFSKTGTFEIEITPALNGQKLSAYRILVIVK